jgi:AhpC/TSA antioxidant enzyme
MFCAEQVAEFRPHYPKLRDAGVNLVVIGSGSPHFAKAFIENEKPEMPVYSDEPRASFMAAGLKRGVSTLLSARMLAKGAKTMFKHRQRKTMGDALQQGGILLVRPGGGVPYSYVSEFPGDHPPTDEVAARALELAAA